MDANTSGNGNSDWKYGLRKLEELVKFSCCAFSLLMAHLWQNKHNGGDDLVFKILHGLTFWPHYFHEPVLCLILLSIIKRTDWMGTWVVQEASSQARAGNMG